MDTEPQCEEGGGERRRNRKEEEGQKREKKEGTEEAHLAVITSFTSASLQILQVLSG